MPAPALPQPIRDTPPAATQPIVGEARTITVAVGKTRTVTLERGR